MSKKIEEFSDSLLSKGIKPWQPNIRVWIEYLCPGILPEQIEEVVQRIQKKFVRLAREALGVSQMGLATMLGVTKRHIQMLEEGSRKTKLQTRLAIQCLLMINGYYKVRLYEPERIGEGLYMKWDLVNWEDAIEAGGFYYDRARYLGLERPTALMVAPEKLVDVSDKEVREAQAAYHEFFKNAEADLVGDALEEVPGHG